jgi:hypothetical protein
MSLVLNGTDNSVSGPAVTGSTGGTGTGLYYPTTNQVALSTNGTQALLINASQQVTIANDASISGLTVGKGGGSLSSNTAFGYLALNLNTSSATRQTGIGYQALYSASTGGSSSAFGYQALYSNTGGYLNNAFGDSAMFSNTSGALNCAFGNQALYSNTTAQYNIAMGYQSLYTNTTGANTTSLGTFALYSNTTASNNTAVGYQAGYSNTTGANNTIMGRLAGYSNTTSSFSCFYGDSSGNASTGTVNTFYGANSGSAVTTGAKNSIFGAYSGNQGGLDIRTASNYIVLSDGDGNPNLFIDNNKVIRTTLTTGFSGTAGTIASNGYSAKAGLTGAFSGNITNLNWQSGTAHFWVDTTDIGQIAFVSDYRIKRNIETQTESGLDKVLKLRPVTYQMADYKELFKAGEEIKEGFIAHEVQAIIPSGVDGEKDAENQIQSLRLDAILAVAVKAIQELNAKVTALEAQLRAK